MFSLLDASTPHCFRAFSASLTLVVCDLREGPISASAPARIFGACVTQELSLCAVLVS